MVCLCYKLYLANRFYKFFLSVKEKNPGMSGELKAMLMPLLVFFVRESYSNGFKPISNRLISDFNRKILVCLKKIVINKNLQMDN